MVDVIRRYCRTAFLLFLGVQLSLSARGSKNSNLIDISKSIVLASRIPCDGATAPEDQVAAKASFTDGPSERAFTLSEYQKGSCKVDVKVHCFEQVKEGWRQDWITTNTQPQKPFSLSLSSCYEWGSKEAAQYVVSAWYKPGGVNKKMPWIQAPMKKLSSNPDVYEFSDPAGATGRLELNRR